MNTPEEAKLQKTLASLQQFEQALARLGDILALKISQQNVLRDATIQRFEFVVELCWKTLKRCLHLEGIEAYTPKEVLKQAFQNHWLEMLEDRNLMSHIYQESQAIAIYENIPRYYPELARLLEFLKQRFE
jgi:nucleotidyltransferase substrate binding protein (TIGR01987 family)